MTAQVILYLLACWGLVALGFLVGYRAGEQTAPGICETKPPPKPLKKLFAAGSGLFTIKEKTKPRAYSDEAAWKSEQEVRKK